MNIQLWHYHFVNRFRKAPPHTWNYTFMINSSYHMIQVNHSQRLNDPQLKPWVVVRNYGVVLGAHCNCRAALGESCSHVSAVLFKVQLPELYNSGSWRPALQQDNDSKYKTKATQEWLNNKKVNVLQWLSQSSDLNPNKNLQHYLKTAVHKHHPANVNNHICQVEWGKSITVQSW